MRNRYLNKEEKIEIMNMFKNGDNTTTIAKKLNRNSSSIQRYLKKMGFELRNNKINLSNESIKDICILYKNGLNAKEIKLKYPQIKSENTIINILKKNNIKIREAQKRISFDDSYFNIIDTEEKAYFLGFILSDGNLYVSSKRNKSYRLQIGINNCDIYILERLKNIIKTSNKIRQCRNECNLSVNSIKLFYQLGYYNIFPRKTYHSALTFSIPKNLYHHYIRGIFDGDGVCVYGKKKKFSFGFCGASKYLILELQTFLIKELDINKTKIYLNQNTYHFDNGGKNDIIKFYRYIYKDATIYLKRKKDKFENYFIDKLIV